VVLCRSAGNIPNLPKPAVKVFLVDFTELSLLLGGLPIPPRFSLHQDEFYIILNYCVWFIRLAKEFAAVCDFKRGIRDFVPDDGI